MIALVLAFRLAAAADLPIADFAPGFDLTKVEHRDVRLSLVPPSAGRAGALRVEAGHTDSWPGLTLLPPGGKWDLAKFAAVDLDITNPTATPVEVGVRIDNPGGDGGKNCIQKVFTIGPGVRLPVSLPLTRRFPPEFGLFGMNGYPGMGSYGAGGQAVDPAHMIQMIIFCDHPKADRLFEVSNIRATGAVPPLPLAGGDQAFFPFIDEFGQYIHKDWPGKLHGIADFVPRKTAEEQDLVGHPAPADRDPWGGWETGPRVEATGHFRPVKRGGVWWLADPDGRLFFSYGVTCAGTWAAGPVEDRDRWYRGLPRDDPAFKEFFWRGDARSDDRYKGRQVLYHDWAAANLFRKYGPGWKEAAGDQAHRRLRSWGFNSTGAWSQPEIYLKRRTPYTVIVHPGGRDLEASEGYWARFKDVFDPAFRKAVRAALAGEKGVDDPWCVGIFVDNELSWGSETDLGEWTIASPAAQIAKRVMVADLRNKYRAIAKLNAAWGTAHASWDALLASRQAPDRVKAAVDLKAFTEKTAETYFATCRDEVRRVAPKTMYLGCRFAWVNDLAARAASRYVSVMSYNLYRREVGSFRLPAGVDLPVIIGEFHCGALDRGPFHTGLQGAPDQAGRARFLEEYADSALRNPAIVGCHWFQYIDEPTTGRFDGENYQIGFVDVCDTPYPETVAAARAVGARLYSVRSAATP